MLPVPPSPRPGAPQAYLKVADEEGAYIKLFDLSSKVTAHQVFGRMTQRVLPYMMSLHISLRPIFLAALPPGYGDASSRGAPCTPRARHAADASTDTRRRPLLRGGRLLLPQPVLRAPARRLGRQARN